MANGAIVDEQISASSEWSRAHRAAYGRLFYTLHSGAWVASDASPWFQIDLKNEHTKVTRIATQGRSGVATCCQWVKTYSLQFSADGKSFSYYKEEGQVSNKVNMKDRFSLCENHAMQKCNFYPFYLIGVGRETIIL